MVSLMTSHPYAKEVEQHESKSLEVWGFLLRLIPRNGFLGLMAGFSARVKGTVTWYDTMRGFGFIMPEDGGEDLFFQQPSINSDQGFLPLEVGETAEFFVSVNNDGRARAVNVTGLDNAYFPLQRLSHSIGFCNRCQRSSREYKKGSFDRASGPCFHCRETEYYTRSCSIMRSENSPRSNLFKLGLLSSLSPLAVGLDLSKYGEEECRRGAEERNWAELPDDVLLLIFKKVSAVGVISSAQFVCRSWQRISHDPDLWRCIDIRFKEGGHLDQTDLESIAMAAVDRSAGCLDGFYAECFGTDGLIGYIAERAAQLRCLHLIAVYEISAEALVKAILKFPLLEDFWISPGSFSDKAVELVGQACPLLKTFRLMTGPSCFLSESDGFFQENLDLKALAIAKHMHRLRHLELYGKNLTNAGLSAIVESCPHLDYLDISFCLSFDIDKNLKKKCARIKDFRPPLEHNGYFYL